MPDMRKIAPQAILVAGYYRSGTSALCGALADLGVQITSDAQANEANPKGFFESTELIKFDIRVLDAMNSYWSDLSDLPEGWIDRADIQLQRDVLAEMLTRQFKDAPLVAVKHPHLCRLLPLYRQAIADIGYEAKVIHTHRSPYAMATSQATKNNMTRAHAVALWSSYITSAERLARDVPRGWVQYHDLLHDADTTVRKTLGDLGIETPGSAGVGFITKSLNRSEKADPEGLFQPLAQLVAEIETAIHDQAEATIWDDLRRRSADIAGFVDELGRSGNRSAPGVGQGMQVRAPGGRAINLAGATKAHPVRPSERGDVSERARVSALLERMAREGGPVPGVSVMIACPHGTTQAQMKDTLESIAQNWHQPAVKLAYCVAPAFDLSQLGLTMDYRFETDVAMITALFEAMSTAKTDYVAILNAGDMLEPDAIARFTLRAAASRADMLYCDEIAPSQSGPWIRAKPAMSMSRLLESCFVGDWVWYRRAAVAALGGFRPQGYPGAEEQDMQIRLTAAGKTVETLPEALFVRGENTRRDSVPLEQATQSAQAAIAAHLETRGIAASVRQGSMPGLFVVEQPGARDPAVTVGVLCKPQVTPDVAQGMVNRLLPHHDGQASRIVFIRHAEMTEAMTRFLDQIDAEVTPSHPSITVVSTEPCLGALIARLQRVAPANHVALVDPVSAPSTNDLLARLVALLDTEETAGVIAPLAFFRDGERSARLHGPLLFGASDRIGAGYEAAAPGPGGWLATTQPVDALDGAVVLVRRDALFDQGADNWVALCASLYHAERALGAFWTPHMQVEIPDPGTTPDHALEAARVQQYRGAHHHPAMTVSGSPLMLEGRYGLVDSDGAVLVSSTDLGDDAKAISWARFMRAQAQIQAAIVGEPLDAPSVLRAKAQGRRWVRINPRSVLTDPANACEIRADLTYWSVLPGTEMRPVVLAADHCVASSRALAARLRGMGARNVSVQPPRLTRDVWTAFKPSYAKTRPAIVWVEETGIDVPWIDQLIAQTGDAVSWTVATRSRRDFAGTVARRPIPAFEEDWARMFAEIGASILVRPTPGANWCDDHIVRIALAAGCRAIVGKEPELGSDIAPLIDKPLSSDGLTRWVKTIEAAARDTPEDAVRRTLLDLPDLWIENAAVEQSWLAPSEMSAGAHDAA
ncbi:hypothetical protein FGG78_18165 [Thioclava sp. BHET1]|nr:hypothetical protein FGG78_18165 [Thioclava sp. BHET1]